MSEDTKTDKMKQKIKSLLNKAGSDAVTDAERDSFISKANELMMKHMIAESELHGLDPNDFIREEIFIGPNSNRTKLLVNLVGCIARPHGVQHAYSEYPAGGRRKEIYAILWGRATTVAGVKAMFERLSVDLLAQISNLNIVPWNDKIEYNRDLSKAANTRQIRDSFVKGYNETIFNRFTELNHQTDSKSDGSFLPVLKSDLDQARDMAGFLQRGKTGRANSSGMLAGMRAGNKASLATGSMPSANKSLESGV